MSFLYLFLYCILFVFIICAFVSIIQFCIDLHRHSALRLELKQLIDRVNSADGEPSDDEEDKDNDNVVS